MPAAKRKRWVCPVCGVGVLAPGRMASDDTRRFCLSCSASSPRLVSRTAPALESARLRSLEKRQARVAAALERARVAEAKRWTVRVLESDGTYGDLDVMEVARECWRLPALAQVRRETPGVRFPELVLRERSDIYCSGRAWDGRVVLSIGQAVSRLRVEELILHELAHVAVGVHHGHDAVYRSCLLMGAFERWPAIRGQVRNEGGVYDMDTRIIEAVSEVQ